MEMETKHIHLNRQLSIVAWCLGRYNSHKFNSESGYTGIRAILIQFNVIIEVAPMPIRGM